TSRKVRCWISSLKEGIRPRHHHFPLANNLLSNHNQLARGNKVMPPPFLASQQAPLAPQPTRKRELGHTATISHSQ
ncbi:hypothetical protein ACHAW6_000183, partial [Cyclotella cf. meneghiniana]